MKPIQNQNQNQPTNQTNKKPELKDRDIYGEERKGKGRRERKGGRGKMERERTFESLLHLIQ